MEAVGACIRAVYPIVFTATVRFAISTYTLVYLTCCSPEENPFSVTFIVTCSDSCGFIHVTYSASSPEPLHPSALVTALARVEHRESTNVFGNGDIVLLPTVEGYASSLAATLRFLWFASC